MDTKVWGFAGWSVLYQLVAKYPKLNPSGNVSDIYHQLFLTLPYVLPCEVCCRHVNEYLSKYPIQDHLKSRRSLMMWLIRLHQSVNLRLGKSQNVISPSHFLIKTDHNFWLFMFAVALEYPESATFEVYQHYMKFYQLLALTDINPAYSIAIKSIQLSKLTNNADLFRWVLKIHNHINTNTNNVKLHCYQQVVKTYLTPYHQKLEHFSLVETDSMTTMVLCSLVMVLWYLHH
jgi:hypothetical protein